MQANNLLFRRFRKNCKPFKPLLRFAVFFPAETLHLLQIISILPQNNFKFVSLKRLLPILSIILLTTFTAPAKADDLTAVDPILHFYPNPAVSSINFEFEKGFDKGYTIQVYNFLGNKKMYDGAITAQRMTLDLSEYTRGVYIYQLRDKTGKITESGKFQVSK